MIKEFKEFAIKGNMMDLAIGVIIGGAFGAVVKSLVDDVIMPPIGALTGGIDFKDLAFTMKAAVGVEGDADFKPAVVLNYGSFINTAITFLIVAFACFMLVKGMNRLRREKEAEPEPEVVPEPSAEEKLLMEIRDLLKAKG
ncbi:MAG: large-conductance mechanosensitive channel protein MscL [Fimbriimonadaceae bacterium]|nr:large-conductance mechanosensitive channel protein MscL [Fimbriimonadaceae bacterium]